MIGIRTDCNNEIGMGHIMRCISIAEALSDIGEEVCFIFSRDSNILSFESFPYRYYILEDDFDIWSAEEVCDILKYEKIKKLFLDLYRVTAKKFDVLSTCADLYYLDDLNLFDYNVSTVINYNIKSSKSDYLPTKYNKRLFLGANYFPLRGEFKKVKRSVINKEIKNVLITTGSTDKNKITKQIIDAIVVENYPHIIFSIIKGKFYDKEYARELDLLRSLKRNIEILEWGQNMAELYSNSDLVIAPGSTTIFEALSLNVPCISFEFVDNQHSQCMGMVELDIAPYIGNFSLNYNKSKKINELFRYMLDYNNRKHFEKNYSTLFDGNGSQRIANIIAGFK